MGNSTRKAIKRKIDRCNGLLENCQEHCVDVLSDYIMGHDLQQVLTDFAEGNMTEEKYTYWREISIILVLFYAFIEMQEAVVTANKNL